MRLDADGSKAERVDFQFATISHLRAEIDKGQSQSDLDADTLVNLRRLLHVHEGANRAQAAQIHGLMADMEELANSKAQSHFTSSSVSSLRCLRFMSGSMGRGSSEQHNVMGAGISQAPCTSWPRLDVCVEDLQLGFSIVWGLNLAKWRSSVLPKSMCDIMICLQSFCFDEVPWDWHPWLKSCHETSIFYIF